MSLPPQHAAWRIARISKRQEPASTRPRHVPQAAYGEQASQGDLALFAAIMAETHAQDLMIKAIYRGAANAKRNGR